MATLAVLFEKAMSIRVEPSDLEKVPHTSRPCPASPDSQTAFGLATAVQGGPTEFNDENQYFDVLVTSFSILILQFFEILITTYMMNDDTYTKITCVTSLHLSQERCPGCWQESLWWKLMYRHQELR